MHAERDKIYACERKWLRKNQEAEEIKHPTSAEENRPSCFLFSPPRRKGTKPTTNSCRRPSIPPNMPYLQVPKSRQTHARSGPYRKEPGAIFSAALPRQGEGVGFFPSLCLPSTRRATSEGSNMVRRAGVSPPRSDGGGPRRGHSRARPAFSNLPITERRLKLSTEGNSHSPPSNFRYQK